MCSFPVIGLVLLFFNEELAGWFFGIFFLVTGIGATLSQSNNQSSQSLTISSTDKTIETDENVTSDGYKSKKFVFREEKMVEVNTNDRTKIDLKLIIKTIDVPDNIYFSSQYQHALNEMIENFKDEYELYESNLKTLEIVFNLDVIFTSLNYIYEDGSNKLIQTYKI